MPRPEAVALISDVARLTDWISKLAIRVEYLENEGQSEIGRHHEDFERVRAVLDKYENLPLDQFMKVSMGDLIREIRQVVG